MHSLVRQYCPLPDVLHEPRVARVFSGDVGRPDVRPAQGQFVDAVFPIALVAMTLAVATASTRVGRMYQIDVGGQGSPQQVFFGTEFYQAPDPSQFVVPIEAVAAVFFVMISLMFVGLGQTMGRAFDAIANRVVAYTVDILGSLAGIAAFGMMSLWRTPPELWFTVAVIVGLRFRPKLTRFQAGCALAVIGLIGFWSYREGTTKVAIWLPYYKIHTPPRMALLRQIISAIKRW